MGLEVATFVNDLNTANPVGGTDQKAQGDDHLRLIKTVLKNTFPGMAAAWKRTDSTAGAGAVSAFTMYRSIAGAVNNLIGSFDLNGQNSAGTERNFVRIIGRLDNVTNGAEISSLLIQLYAAGAGKTIAVFPLLHDMPVLIPVPVNGSYKIVQKSAFPFILQETVSICTSGTITATFRKNGVAIGGAANAVSVAEASVLHTDSFAAGDDLDVIFSANAGCLNAALNVVMRREG